MNKAYRIYHFYWITYKDNLRTLDPKTHQRTKKKEFKETKFEIFLYVVILHVLSLFFYLRAKYFGASRTSSIF